MAFGQLSKAAGNSEYAAIARKTFSNILARSGNPKGAFTKTIAETRALKGFSLPMILCNLSLEIEHLLEAALVEETVERCIHEVMEVFYDPESGLMMEHVDREGNLSDTFEGRLLNPGHGIEAMWFIMDLAVRLGRPALIEKAIGIILRTLEYSWDKEYGGIYYFLDRRGFPPQQLEWDQKLWWVHVETLISLIKGYALTGNPACLEWFHKVHEYTWAHFPDPEFGEWYGYLNRRGEVLLPLKGGKWKGCFHVPRGLLNVWKTLEQINTGKNG
jgi:N-acylglucosamine 2-epimerase